MNETLFEMLLDLFETTLLRLKEASELKGMSKEDITDVKTSSFNELEKKPSELLRMWMVKEAGNNSMRVFSQSEQHKLTKASYQFLLRLQGWGIISTEFMELIINLLFLSTSGMVSLRETKWTIRSLLADKLPAAQLAYLDLVLYHQEDAIVRH